MTLFPKATTRTDDSGACSPDIAPLLSLSALTVSDLDTIMDLERRVFADQWTREAMITELNNPCAFYVVGRTGERIVGYGGQWIIMDESHITSLAVEPDVRGQRIGERLLIALLQEARYRGARRATLEVRAGNRPAVALYEKYGFRSVAIRKKYYQSDGEDALVMWIDDLFAAEVSALIKQPFGAEPAE